MNKNCRLILGALLLFINESAYAWTFHEIKSPYYPKFYMHIFDKVSNDQFDSEATLGSVEERKTFTHDGIVSSRTETLLAPHERIYHHGRTDYPLDNISSNEQYVFGINETRKLIKKKSTLLVLKRFNFDPAGKLLSTIITSSSVPCHEVIEVVRDSFGRIGQLNHYMEKQTQAYSREFYSYDESKETVSIADLDMHRSQIQIFDKKTQSAVGFDLFLDSIAKDGTRIRKERVCEKVGYFLTCDETTTISKGSTKRVKTIKGRYALVRRVITNSKNENFYRSEVIPLYEKTETGERTWTYNEHYQVLVQLTTYPNSVVRTVTTYDAEGDFTGQEITTKLNGHTKVVRTVLRSSET